MASTWQRCTFVILLGHYENMVTVRQNGSRLNNSISSNPHSLWSPQSLMKLSLLKAYSSFHLTFIHASRLFAWCCCTLFLDKQTLQHRSWDRVCNVLLLSVAFPTFTQLIAKCISLCVVSSLWDVDISLWITLGIVMYVIFYLFIYIVYLIIVHYVVYLQ